MNDGSLTSDYEKYWKYFAMYFLMPKKNSIEESLQTVLANGRQKMTVYTSAFDIIGFFRYYYKLLPVLLLLFLSPQAEIRLHPQRPLRLRNSLLI